MHSRHGVSVLRTLFEPALLELQRGPIELVDQLGMPLPQPFLGQELSGQTLEPRDDPAVVGIHAATPLLPSPRPRGVWLMRGTRADGQRPATALRRPAIQYSGGIALHLPRPNTPRPNTWPLNSQRLGRFRPYCPSHPLRPTVWRVYHIPPDKLLACFGNFRRHSSARRAMAPGHAADSCGENCVRSFGNRPRVSALPFVLSQQSFGYCPRAKRSRST